MAKISAPRNAWKDLTAIAEICAPRNAWKDMLASQSTRSGLAWVDDENDASVGVQLWHFMIEDPWSNITRLKDMTHFTKKMFVHSMFGF